VKRTAQARLAIAISMSAYAIAWLLWDHWRAPASGIDFDQLWYAATALRRGLNPYIVVGPRGPWYVMPWPLYYPMPAILLVWPLSFLPLLLARCIFVAIPTGVLAYGMTRAAWWPLLLFLSGAYIEAARLGQWSILFSCALIYPVLAVAFPAKPTAAMISASAMPRPSRYVAVIAFAAWTALLGVSFAVFPCWLVSWLAVVRDAPHIRPMLLAPGGFLLLLGVLRWRQRAGRMLLAYALVPHLRVVYEALPLLVLAESRPWALLLAVGSLIAYTAQAILVWPTDPTMVSPRLAEWSLVCIYLPALVMTLYPHQSPDRTARPPTN
jgi:hypothetical protein